MKPDLKKQHTRLAALLQERGPRITEIARELGESPETVRYWFKHNILGRRGVVYQAIPNHELLGFKRTRAVVDFSDVFLPHARDILIAMNRFCYLSNYFRIFPSGFYSLLLTVPSQLSRYYDQLLRDMEDIGIFRFLQVDHLDWIRIAPMKARYFDFSTGRWDFDWSAITNGKEKVASQTSSERLVRYDYEDLLLLEELQVDATRSLGEISRELKMPYPQVYNHYSHIAERRQILLYRILWPATGPRDQEEMKAWQQHHAHIGLEFLVRNSTGTECRELLTKMERLPFMFSSGAGRGNFYSSFIIPLEYYSETFQYLSEALLNSRGRTEFCVGDQANALGFTVPIHLYDKEANAWINNVDETLAKFKNLVLTIEGS